MGLKKPFLLTELILVELVKAVKPNQEPLLLNAEAVVVQVSKLLDKDLSQFKHHVVIVMEWDK